MQALLLKDKGHPTSNFELGKADVPKCGEHDIIIKNQCIGLNPVDWKMAKYGFLIKQFPAVIGCDASGTVSEVGAKVENFKKGDAVWTSCVIGYGGSYAEYTAVPANNAGVRPDNISAAEGAALGVGVMTAVVGLYHHFKLKPAWEVVNEEKQEHNHAPWVLVWGAATSVGMYAVQLAHLSGYRVIGTASAKNHELLQSLGADCVMDYKQDEADLLRDIHKATHGKLHYALDCVGGDAGDLCVKALAHQGDKLDGDAVSLLASTVGAPAKPLPAHVKFQHILLANSHNVPSEAKVVYKAYEEVPKLLAKKLLKPNPVVAQKPGLEHVVQGLEMLAAGKVSAQKIVVPLHKE